MLNISILENDLRGVINDLPAIIEYDGQSIIGYAGTVTNGAAMDYMGIAESEGLSVGVPVSDFKSQPTPKDLMTVNGDAYIISSVRCSADGVQYVIALEKESAEVMM